MKLLFLLLFLSFQAKAHTPAEKAWLARADKAQKIADQLRAKTNPTPDDKCQERMETQIFLSQFTIGKFLSPVHGIDHYQLSLLAHPEGGKLHSVDDADKIVGVLLKFFYQKNSVDVAGMKVVYMNKVEMIQFKQQSPMVTFTIENCAITMNPFKPLEMTAKALPAN